ncbi:MAG: pyridoxamine 5'-phosphate oxidase family protein [Planctomycetes bacterium]|nr:pyridoxamine 5'-phosphate oxidase family protein [Planctomycetota bacterium]
MRRKDREITDIATIEGIIHKGQVCRLGLSENGRPYIIPLCFGYKDNNLYFHTAREGKKLDILRKNNNVCFEITIDNELVKSKEACGYNMKYQSVIGFGKATFIEDIDSKRKAFDIIMQNYSYRSFEYPVEAIKNTVIIIKVEIESMTGKKSAY